MLTETLTWLGIALCVSQSAMFSGLNLAFFSLSRLRLEVEVAAGNTLAAKVLTLRKDPNSLLTTILLGNVSVNVLLTMLSDSVLAGVAAFLFSTIVITTFGEILPQAYFSRNALRVSSMLSPLFRFYQVLLYPISKPVALLLDKWLGREGMVMFREREMRHLIRKHIEASEADIDRIEGLGALNFLAIDDVMIEREGEPLNPASIVHLEFTGSGEPCFPSYQPQIDRLIGKQSVAQETVSVHDETGPVGFVDQHDPFLPGRLYLTQERVASLRLV